VRQVVHETPPLSRSEIVVLIPDSHGPNFLVDAASIAVAIGKQTNQPTNVILRAVPVDPTRHLRPIVTAPRKVWRILRRAKALVASPRRVWRLLRRSKALVASPLAVHKLFSEGRLRNQASKKPIVAKAEADFDALPWSSEALNVQLVDNVFLDAIARAQTTRGVAKGHSFFLTSQNSASAYAKYEVENKLGLSVDKIFLVIERVSHDLRLTDILKAILLPISLLALSPVYFCGRIGQTWWKHRLLQSCYRGVPVGDIVASDTLARSRRGFGCLRPSLSAYQSALEACLIVHFTESSLSQGNMFAFTPELTYRHAIVSRTVAVAGGKALRRRFNGELVAYEDWTCTSANLSFPVVRDGVVVQRSLRESKSQVASMTSWMNQRTSRRNALVAWHSEKPSSSAESALQLIQESTASRIIVLFLHDLRDAQLYCGVDELVDLYSWSHFVIAESSKHKNTLVVVKQHPAGGTTADRGNRKALERLKKKFEPRGVIFLDNSTVLHDVLAAAKVRQIIGITHHGTVAEELAWLNIPVVASRVGPWGRNFQFCSTWDTVSELRELLAAEPDELRRHISGGELLSYLLNRYSGQESKALHELVWEMIHEFVPEYHINARYWVADEVLRYIGMSGMSRIIGKRAQLCSIDAVYVHEKG